MDLPLPDEILLTIFKHLFKNDLMNVREVSKRWYQIASDMSLFWNYLQGVQFLPSNYIFQKDGDTIYLRGKKPLFEDYYYLYPSHIIVDVPNTISKYIGDWKEHRLHIIAKSPSTFGLNLCQQIINSSDNIDQLSDDFSFYRLKLNYGNVRYWYRHTPLMLALASKDRLSTEICQLLIEAGADVNLRGVHNTTYLIQLVRWGGNIDKMKLLIDAGINVNTRDHKNYNILVRATQWVREDILEETFQLLEEAGAEPGLIDWEIHRRRGCGWKPKKKVNKINYVGIVGVATIFLYYLFRK